MTSRHPKHGWRFEFSAQPRIRRSRHKRPSVPGIYHPRTTPSPIPPTCTPHDARAKTQQSKCKPTSLLRPLALTRFADCALALTP